MALELRNLTNNLIAMLGTATGRPVGDADVPEHDAEVDVLTPYVVVLLSPSPGPIDGDYQDPESVSLVDYQTKLVGVTRLQAQWMQDKVCKAITQRTPGGNFLQAWPSPDCNIIDRSLLTIGAILPTGPDLFEGNDIYRIKIGRLEA